MLLPPGNVQSLRAFCLPVAVASPRRSALAIAPTGILRAQRHLVARDVQGQEQDVLPHQRVQERRQDAGQHRARPGQRRGVDSQPRRGLQVPEHGRGAGREGAGGEGVRLARVRSGAVRGGSQEQGEADGVGQRREGRLLPQAHLLPLPEVSRLGKLAAGGRGGCREGEDVVRALYPAQLCRGSIPALAEFFKVNQRAQTV